MPIFSIRAKEHILSQLFISFIAIASRKSRTETETGTGGGCTVPKNFNISAKPFLSELMFQI
jgi:hypothetical protein